MRRSFFSTRSVKLRPILRCERLEDRLTPSIAADEQLFVYMLNRARHDPAAYQLEQGLGIDLSAVAPQPPLAVNSMLFDSSEFHAQEMADRNYFAHTNPEGLTPNEMVRNAGYTLNGIFAKTGNNVESLAAGNLIDTAAESLNLLIIDAGVNPPGHRIHLLGMNSFFADHREIGVGHGFNINSTYDNYWAIHTAQTSPNDKFLTGVVFNDKNGNLRYDLNEGLAGVTITAGALTTTTNAAGGWAIKVSGTGMLSVTASGGGYVGTGSANVNLSSSNIEIDFISNRSAGIINFNEGGNNAPVLNTTPAPALPAINEDDTSPAGVLISTLIGNAITDADAGAIEGIAITAASGSGTWQFSADGSTWTDVGSVSNVAARLLPDTYRVRFVAAANVNGSASFTFRAWDQTSGTAGDTGDSSMNGGSTAFSMAADSASITINPVNDAPDLDNSGNPMLPAINEDTTAPTGVTLSSLIGSITFDVDAGALKGIAVTNVDNANGTWQFSTGGAWVNFGAASNSAARLLRDTDRVRFVPTAEFSGSASFTFRAWDRTTGVVGGTADATSNGGTTAFSTAVETAGINVLPLNDAPILAAGTSELPDVIVNANNPSGITVDALIGSAISDADVGALRGIAVVGITGGNGTWQFSTNGGANWTTFGTVSGSSARLLDAAHLVRFVPNTNYTLTSAASIRPTLTLRAWDQTAGVAGGTLNINATGQSTAFSNGTRQASIRVNSAPALNGTVVTLPTILEDSLPLGTTVASLAGAMIADLGTGVVKGIAVTGVDNSNGTWQYSIGGAWIAFGSPSTSTARLLRDTDKVRFLPFGNYHGSATFSFRAWDRTVGGTGGTADSSAAGGTSAFSTAIMTGSVTVSPVNDAPVLAPGAPQLPAVVAGDANPAGITVAALAGASITDVDVGAPEGIAVTGLTATTSGIWQFSTNGGANWTNFGAASVYAARLLADDDRIRFLPNATFTMTTTASLMPSITFRAWDRTSGTAGLTASAAAAGGSNSFSLATRTAKVRVNAAPTLIPAARTLGPAGTTSPFVITIASLLGSSVTDIGTGGLEGIAVTGLTTTGIGRWQYSIGGGALVDFGSVSAANARLLRATDRLRYVPQASLAGSPTITFQAWDQTTNATGQIVDLTVGGSTGGTSAFSLAIDTATLHLV